MEKGELKREDVATAFGQVLRKLREDRGLSQEKLGELSYMDRMHVYYMERGDRQPSLTSMLHLARALGIPFPDLARAVEEELGT